MSELHRTVKGFSDDAFRYYHNKAGEALVFDQALFQYAIAVFSACKLVTCLRNANAAGQETVDLPRTLVEMLNISPSKSLEVLRKVYVIIPEYNELFRKYTRDVQRQWQLVMTNGVSCLTLRQQKGRESGRARWERFVRTSFAHMSDANIQAVCAYSSGLRFLRLTERKTTQLLHYLVMVMNCMHAHAGGWHLASDTVAVLRNYPNSVYK